MAPQRITYEQQSRLLDWLEENPDIAAQRFTSKFGSARLSAEWAKLAQILNCLGSGPQKTGKEWSQTFRDMKGNTKKKYVKIHQYRERTGGGNGSAPPDLTDHETRLLSIIGIEQVAGLPVGETAAPPVCQVVTAILPQIPEFVDAEIEILQCEKETDGEFDKYDAIDIDNICPALEESGSNLKPVPEVELKSPQVDKTGMRGVAGTRKRKNVPANITTPRKKIMSFEERFLQIEEDKVRQRDVELHQRSRQLDLEERQLELFEKITKVFEMGIKK